MKAFCPWGSRELHRARHLVMEEGNTCEQADAVLGRARGSTYQKLFGRGASPEDLERREEYTKRRQQIRAGTLPRGSRSVIATFLPPQVITERDTAHAADRSLSQELFGDPLPGRSALDRMRAGQS